MATTYDDEGLNDFLQALDGSDVEVNKFESEFIDSNLDTYEFSEKQREVVEAMISRYGNRIGWL